jgi:hypothetical protein
MVLRKVPRISGSSNRITPRPWVSITSSSLVLAGATGTNLARACSVNGAGLKGWLHHLRLTGHSAVEVIGAVLGAVRSRARRGLGAVAAR